MKVCWARLIEPSTGVVTDRVIEESTLVSAFPHTSSVGKIEPYSTVRNVCPHWHKPVTTNDLLRNTLCSRNVGTTVPVDETRGVLGKHTHF